MIDIVFLLSEITKGMKSFGPKALIPVGKKNQDLLIQKQILSIVTALKNHHVGKYKINLVVGFEYEKVCKALKTMNNKIHILYHDNYEQDNAGGAIRLALNGIGKSNYLFIENGVIAEYFPPVISRSIIPVFSKSHHEAFEIGITKNKKIEYLFYDLYPRWSELLFLSSKHYDKVMEITSNNQIEHMFLFEYVNLLLENDIEFDTDIVFKKQITKVINHKQKL